MVRIASCPVLNRTLRSWGGFFPVWKFQLEPDTDIQMYQCKKTCQFKTWCKGDKSNIENSTDHFCEDIRQNALTALTNLVTWLHFYCLDPLIIWRYNGWEKSLHWIANYQIRPKFTYDLTLLQRKLVRIQVALYSHSSAACWKLQPYGSFPIHPTQNSRPIHLIEECFGVKWEDLTTGQTDPKWVYNHCLFYCLDLFVIWRSNRWL